MPQEHDPDEISLEKPTGDAAETTESADDTEKDDTGKDDTGKDDTGKDAPTSGSEESAPERDTYEPAPAARTAARSSKAAPASKARRAAPRPTPEPARRAPSGTVRTVLATVLVIALVVVSVLLYLQTRTLDTARQAAADRARAEQIASDYAVKAATMDYRDLTPWLNAVKAGTTPELSKSYDGIIDILREVMTPLRMTSTGKASFAKTTSEVNGIYQVKVAVDVSGQSIQAPQGTLSTSTYSVSIDKNRDWVITEAGDPANPSAVLRGLGGAPSASASATPAPQQPATPTMPDLPATPN